MIRSLTLLALVVVCAGLSAACQDDAPPPPPPAANTKKVDPATAGSLSGRITFAGARPPVEALRMGSDQACVQGAGPNPQSDAVLISDSGGLQNVYVHVLTGLDPEYGFDVPTSPAVLDQKGCVYTPRVIGVRAGQPIEIVNSDPTLHNVHAIPMKNGEFNKGQPVQGMREKQVFTVPEVMVRFKCDVHGWMAAWVGVSAHPFFAVTDADGRFEIKGLPPGTYTIEAWHEKFGRQTGDVVIAPNQPQTLSLTFTAAPSGS
jgi:plastocyanin